jgi:hypothetical protein
MMKKAWMIGCYTAAALSVFGCFVEDPSLGFIMEIVAVSIIGFLVCLFVTLQLYYPR